MNINLRTDFYKFDKYSVEFSENEVLFVSDTNKIAIPYDNFLNITVKEGQTRTTPELLTKNKTFETVVDTVLEAELFIKDLSEVSKKPLCLNIDFKK